MVRSLHGILCRAAQSWARQATHDPRWNRIITWVPGAKSSCPGLRFRTGARPKTRSAPATQFAQIILRVHLAPVILTIAFGATFCAAQSGRGDEPKRPTHPSIAFEEIAAKSGISFRFENGSLAGQHDLPEIMGGGVALFDADGDGLLDLYFCNGGPIDRGRGQAGSACRLYRNQGRLAIRGHHRPGRARRTELCHGRGGRRLRRRRPRRPVRHRLARSAALSQPRRWPVRGRDPARRPDVERLEHRRRRSPTSTATATWTSTSRTISIMTPSRPLLRGPGRPPRLSAGPRTFPPSPIGSIATTATGRSPTSRGMAGIDLPEGRGLGVLIAELTGDNRPDIYVANDRSPCWLFANRGNLRFEEIGEEAGVARDGQGEVLSGMGVAAGRPRRRRPARPGRHQLLSTARRSPSGAGHAARRLSRRLELAGSDGRHAPRPRLRAGRWSISTATAAST